MVLFFYLKFENKNNNKLIKNYYFLILLLLTTVAIHHWRQPLFFFFSFFLHSFLSVFYFLKKLRTNIALSPKKNTVGKISDYKPISLTTALYKILSKVLAERLKKTLGETISLNQSAFIRGRQIFDAI